jgi:glycosyltransferase involved in cell wall biosynthesis
MFYLQSTKIEYICLVATVKTVSICAPAFNEVTGIDSVLKAWESSLEKSVQSKLIAGYEIIICDDGSTDGTVEALNSIKLKNLVIVKNSRNLGAGVAIKNAIANSQMNYVVTIDSDGQFNLNEALNWFTSIKDDEIVLGYRKKNDRLMLKLGSWISTQLFKYTLSQKAPDANCMLKLIPGNLARNLDLRAVGLNYSGEMTYLLMNTNHHLKWEPVTHADRIGGKSSAKLIQDGFKRILFQMFLMFELKLINKNVISKRSGL